MELGAVAGLVELGAMAQHRTVVMAVLVLTVLYQVLWLLMQVAVEVVYLMGPRLVTGD